MLSYYAFKYTITKNYSHVIGLHKYKCLDIVDCEKTRGGNGRRRNDMEPV